MGDEPTIELVIAPDGTVRFEVKGVSGADCEALEQLVREAVGGEVRARERTAEYYAERRSAAVERLRTRLKRG